MKLPSNLTLVPYIENGKRTYVNDEKCHDAFIQMQIESESDKLSKNYKFNELNLHEMINFNFVFDGDNPVQASGCQKMSNNVIRVCSRYYLFDDYRTDNTNPLNKIDDFYELQYSLKSLKNYPLIIWSREKSPSFFKRIKENRLDIFSEWEVYPEKVELKFKNNFQSVFYYGDKSYMSEMQPTK
jgi:hypothetical protein